MTRPGGERRALCRDFRAYDNARGISLRHTLSARVRAGLALVLTLLLTVAMSVAVAPAASAYPPRIPSQSTAKYELSKLVVKAEYTMTGYSRDKFQHWVTVTGACNTREMVLKRDGTNVVVGSDCYPDSGKWYSHYDGKVEYQASEIDIDHVVALAEAWRSGAKYWTADRRRQLPTEPPCASAGCLSPSIKLPCPGH